MSKVTIDVKDYILLLNNFCKWSMGSWTKSYKKKIGKCEVCDVKREDAPLAQLDFAHYGSRKEMITKLVMEEGLSHTENWQKLKNIHTKEPWLVGTVLCKTCHKEFDKTNKNKKE